MTKGIGENLSGYVSNWSYASFDGGIENYTTVGATYKTGKTCFSLGAGTNTNINENGCRISPTVEGKVNYNFGEGFTAQVRGRYYNNGNKEPIFQARTTVTKKFNTPITNLKPYIAAHVTDKMSPKGHSATTGAWVGVSYNINKKLALSAEFQQNIPLNRVFQWNDGSKRMLNLGISYNF